MEQTEQPELFEIKLNASGILYVRKVAVMARVVIVTSIFLALISITTATLRILKIDPSIYKDKFLGLYYRVLPFYLGVYFVFFFVQLYYFLKISQHLKKGIDYNDDTLFNKSFHTLYRYTVIGIIISFVVLLMNAFDLFVVIRIYYRN
jgi:hypothetical protein